MLGYSPTHRCREGFVTTAEWYLQNTYTPFFLNHSRFRLKVAILGLGAFQLLSSPKTNVIGFDINEARIDELNAFSDSTREICRGASVCIFLHLHQLSDLRNANCYIITVLPRCL